MDHRRQVLGVFTLLAFSVSHAVFAQVESTTAPQDGLEARVQDLSVPVLLPSGRTAQLHARLCRPAGEEAARLVVINHGTPPRAEDRKKMQLLRCESEAVQWFLQRGYVVAFALRRGYGDSSEAGVENFSCNHADYVRAGLESAIDINAVVNYFTSRFPFVQHDTVVMVGQSTGGWATLAYNAVPHPQVSAFINMAGGRGGHHDDRPNDNCRPDLLREAAHVFGKTSTTPMLWIYTANDSFFDPKLAHSLWREFTAAGGQADLKELGPFGSDGHTLFFGHEGSKIWGPLVEAYLR